MPSSSARDPVTAYARDVLARRIVAGPHVRDACARHLADLKTAAARGWIFDRAMVAHAIDFFAEMLCLNSGEFEGAPFELEPWQAFIVGSLFGWRDPAGQRRFRVAFVETGKGSGKSPLAAGIGLYMLVADGEPRAEVYAAASKKDQAMILFRDAVSMVEQSPELARRVHRTGGRMVWNLSYEESFFRPISSEDGQSGPRPHCGLIDEVHEHRDDTVIEMMRAGFKARRSPLLFMITNAGVDRESVCWRYHDKATKVCADTLQDDRFFGYVCALDDGEDPLEDEACWAKTNPNLGVSIRMDYLRDQVAEARQMPSKESMVRRLHFCQWVDAFAPWISGAAWRACEYDAPVPMAVEFNRQEVVLAVDLSTTTDLTALAIVAARGRELHAAVEFWTPADTLIARAERDKVPYDVWVKAGYLHTVPGSTLDYGPIADRIVELCDIYSVREIVFDRYRIAYLKRELDDRGMYMTLTEHPQTFMKPARSSLWMPQSINELEAAILKGELFIRRNPVLTWCNACATVETDLHQSRIFSKKKSTGRIDGVVALAMAVGALRAPSAFDAGAMVA